MNRCDFGSEIREHPLDDEYHKERSPVWAKIKVPLFTAANWGGQGLHPRGNFEGFVRAASKQKWLEAHGIEHWTHYYTDYGRELQLKFFDHFLHGKKNGWDEQPPVLLQVRHIDQVRGARGGRVADRPHQMDEALPGPCRRRAAGEKRHAPTRQLNFEAMGDGVTFLTAPLDAETEITGPSALEAVRRPPPPSTPTCS